MWSKAQVAAVAAAVDDEDSVQWQWQRSTAVSMDWG
jgi:hypothetical protein